MFKKVFFWIPVLISILELIHAALDRWAKEPEH